MGGTATGWAIFGLLVCQVAIEGVFGAPRLLTVVNEAECDGEVAQILANLRAVMRENNLEAYLVPNTDAHLSEYIANQDKRLEYISKFTGSAGDAVVTLDEAALWTDSRYHLQAEQQMNLNCWKVMKKGLSGVPTISEWLISSLPANGSRVGVDPFLISATEFASKQSDLNGAGHELLSMPNNLVDAIWINRPEPSDGPIIPLDIQYSGKRADLKIAQVMEAVTAAGGESVVITALDDIAWLLNLRGSDIEYNPLFFGYVLLTPAAAGRSALYANKTKSESAAVRQHFAAELIDLAVRPYDEFPAGLEEVVNATSGKLVLPVALTQAVAQLVPPGRRILRDVVTSLKVVKNEVEARNMEEAHVRDAVALVKYLHWLEENIDAANITELSGADQLSEFRAQQDNFRGLSFEAISAVGEHAAMAHFSPTPETTKRISREEIYLVDSGGQYWDGTTDVTRTVHHGTPSQEERQCYTRVLKGFIAFQTARFPKTAPMSYLDFLARHSLWQAGLDYGHSTGHGVGMYLSVHEYPPLVSYRASDPLQANIFTSDEPGYYKDNEFGIRIEDVVQVVPLEDAEAFGGAGGYGIRSITYAPIATNLVERRLLTDEELAFLNEYNQRVRDTVGTRLLKYRDMAAYQWLVKATQKLL